MANQSGREKLKSIIGNQGQAILELVLIALFILTAILSIIEGFQIFDKDSQRFLQTKEIKRR